MGDLIAFGALAVSVVAAGVAVWQSGMAKESARAARDAANLRRVHRETLADVITPGQTLLEEIVKAKPLDDDSFFWNRHTEWVDQVATTLAAIDRSRLIRWNKRIDDNEIEAATRERLTRAEETLETLT